MFDSNEIYIEDQLTIDYILCRVSEEEIIKYYFGIDIDFGYLVRNPARVDNEPTCSWSYYDGKLKLRDWSEHISQDVFDLVGRKYKLGFYDTLKKIYLDLRIGNRKESADIIIAREERKIFEKKRKKIIQTKRFKDFLPEHKEYLKGYGITREIANKFNCFPIKQAWVEGTSIYLHSRGNPCLGYYFGKSSKTKKGKWKLYFYKEDKIRFYCNTSRIQGWSQLPNTGKYVVITKSLKDIMVLYRYKVPSIAMQSESVYPHEHIIKELKIRFEKIFSLYDFDPAGIRMAGYLKRTYGIKPIFLTNGKYGSIRDYGAKDISDFRKYYGHDKTKNLIDRAKKILL